MTSELDDLARRWTALGAADPLWAALTDRPPGTWSTAEFLRSGRQEVDRLLALLRADGHETPRRTALDFGCGPGRLTAALAGAGFARVIGVDVSPTMIDAARRTVRDTRCEFLLNRRADLGVVPSASVDLVYSARVLQHVPPCLAASYVREFLRVVAPDGVVAFQLPSRPVGAAGRLVRLAPQRLLEHLRSGMRMHGAEPRHVVELIASVSDRRVVVHHDDSAGPRWRSHLYVVSAR